VLNAGTMRRHKPAFLPFEPTPWIVAFAAGHLPVSVGRPIRPTHYGEVSAGHWFTQCLA